LIGYIKKLQEKEKSLVGYIKKLLVQWTVEGLNQDKCDREEKSVEDGIPPPKRKNNIKKAGSNSRSTKC